MEKVSPCPEVRNFDRVSPSKVEIKEEPKYLMKVVIPTILLLPTIRVSLMLISSQLEKKGSQGDYRPKPKEASLSCLMLSSPSFKFGILFQNLGRFNYSHSHNLF